MLQGDIGLKGSDIGFPCKEEKVAAPSKINDLAKLLFESAEYIGRNRTDGQYVGDLFQTFLHRAPTPGESSSWTALVAGTTRNLVLLSFAFGPEFNTYLNGILGPPTARPEYNLMNDFYRGVLNRLPESAGFNFWLGQIKTAQCTGAQQVANTSNTIASLFFHSAEYAGRARNNPGYVEDVYDAIMRRNADLGGYNFWVGVLNASTWTRDGVLAFFTQSPEFQTRVNQVIAAGCVP